MSLMVRIGGMIAAVSLALIAACGSSSGSGAIAAPAVQRTSASPTQSATPTPSRENVDRVFTNVEAATHILNHLDSTSLSAITSEFTQAAESVQRASQIAGGLEGVDTGPLTDALSALADGLNSTSSCLTTYIQQVAVDPSTDNPCQGPEQQIGPLASAAGGASVVLLPYSSFTSAQIQAALRE